MKVTAFAVFDVRSCFENMFSSSIPLPWADLNLHRCPFLMWPPTKCVVMKCVSGEPQNWIWLRTQRSFQYYLMPQPKRTDFADDSEFHLLHSSGPPRSLLVTFVIRLCYFLLLPHLCSQAQGPSRSTHTLTTSHTSTLETNQPPPVRNFEGANF